jgi:hypothetical protein
MRIRLPARTSPTLNANRFAYNLSRLFEFEALWRRIAARYSKNADARTPDSNSNSNGESSEPIAPDFDSSRPSFLCPFCGCPFVRFNTVTTQSADAGKIPSARITLRCPAVHEVWIQCAQYPDHVEITSEAQAPPLSFSARRSSRY